MPIDQHQPPPDPSPHETLRRKVAAELVDKAYEAARDAAKVLDELPEPRLASFMRMGMVEQDKVRTAMTDWVGP